MKFLKGLRRFGVLTGVLVIFQLHSFAITDSKIDSILDIATYQYQKMIGWVNDTTKYPRSTSATQVDPIDWTSGFFPGALWYLYELTDDSYWRTHAERWTQAIESQTGMTIHHDLGFMFYCSFGNGYRLTGNTNYKDIMLQASKTLWERYDDNVGCMDSWDWGQWTSKFAVIIDNMMNLELLYWAALEENRQDYYYAAEEHGKTTMFNHFRPDNSSYHLVEYNPTTGAVIKKQTVQGYSDNSAWARGQAWGLYGYAMSYRETGNPAFLEQAEKIAGFILNHPDTPDDLIPYWDYDDPTIPSASRDASAGAIMASAFLELSLLSDTGEIYFNRAEDMLESLMTDEYFNAKDENMNFLLDHSVGHKPANSEIDVPLIYADYYFLEAIARYKRLKGWKNIKPKFEEIEDLKSYPNDIQEIPVTVYDDIIDSVTISVVDAPAFAEYANDAFRKGIVTLNPTSGDIDKEYQIILVATDKFGAKDTVSFNISIYNDEPVFQEIADVVMYSEETDTIPIVISDEMIDSIKFDTILFPDFATLTYDEHNNGIIILKPTNENVKNESAVTLVATDEYGEKDTLSFSVKVLYNYFDKTIAYASTSDPYKTIDDNLSSLWSTRDSGAFIVYNFLEAGYLREMSIAFFSGDVRKTNYKLEFSTDSIHWTEVHNGSSSGLTDSLDVVYSGNAIVQYIRITGYGNELSDFTTIREVSFDFVPGATAPPISEVEHTLVNNELQVYPNPCINELYIPFNNTDNSHLSIYNISGGIVLSATILQNESIHIVNVSELEPGVYIYNIVNNNKVYTGKFIKQ